jgi:UDP-glucose 4-epimerase
MAQKVAGAEAYNLGIGKGYSVKEVIAVCRKVTGVPIEYAVVGRRPGDPPRLVGNADKARRELGWTPEYGDLVGIVETAWRYVEARPASMAR